MCGICANFFSEYSRLTYWIIHHSHLFTRFKIFHHIHFVSVHALIVLLTCVILLSPLLLLLSRVCWRYRPSIAVSFVESELGFTEEEQCVKFLQDLGVVLTADGTKIDCKQSQGIITASWPAPTIQTSHQLVFIRENKFIFKRMWSGLVSAMPSSYLLTGVLLVWERVELLEYFGLLIYLCKYDENWELLPTPVQI